MLNLDTHIVVALLNRTLTAEEYRRIADEELGLSDIVLWELAMLANRGRLALDLDAPAFRSFIGSIKVFPVTLEIARQSTLLDFTSDPADEIIAATSIVENIPLMTRDRRIRRSKMVPLAL
ncbi:MAG: type II toxin-antitoxin system VapC family toxin [Terriglobia bacterium]|jgi:PIN domain nuclease of toxin-antitoxin system